MTHAITITLHGLKAAVSDIISGQSRHEDRYTITSSQYHSLVRDMANHPTCTISKSLEEPDGNLVILTFDDGMISDFEQAFPVLQAAGLKATFFVTVENIGRPGYMNLEQIREMAAHGMEIGSHGLNHRYLVTLSEAAARQEICDSRDKLQQLLGLNVHAYAPVGGHYVPWMLEVARNAGYRAFASMVPGRTMISPNTSFHFFRRNHLQSHHDLSYISALIRGEKKILLLNEFRYYLLAFPKRLLGMQTYDRLKHILARGEVD